MRGWWPSRRRAAPGRTRAASGSAETTTSGCDLISRQAPGRSALIGLGIGACLGLGILMGNALYAVAFGAEAELPGAAGQIKEIASNGGIYGPLLGLSLIVIGTLFTLYLRERGVRDLALSAQSVEHARQLKEADDAHARDRAEWHASTTLLQEARIGQLREVLQGLNGATEMIRSTQAIIAERSQTSAEQNTRMAEMAQSLSAVRIAIETETASTRRALVSMGEEVAAAVKRVGG